MKKSKLLFRSNTINLSGTIIIKTEDEINAADFLEGTSHDPSETGKYKMKILNFTNVMFH